MTTKEQISMVNTQLNFRSKAVLRRLIFGSTDLLSVWRGKGRIVDMNFWFRIKGWAYSYNLMWQISKNMAI